MAKRRPSYFYNFLFCLSDIQAAFKQFDKNGDGEISIEELGEAMKAAGQQVTEEALKDMMRAIDYNGEQSAFYTQGKPRFFNSEYI